MGKATQSSIPYRPDIEVRPWVAPSTGDVYFRAIGPFQLRDPRASLMTRCDLMHLRTEIDRALGTDDSEAV